MQVGILQIFQNYQGRSRDEDVVHSEARIARLAETLGYDKLWAVVLVATTLWLCWFFA